MWGRGVQGEAGGQRAPPFPLRTRLCPHRAGPANPPNRRNHPKKRGATHEGQLLLGSHIEDLDGCDPTATAFPGGTLFASERHTLAYLPGERGWVISDDGDYPGRLFSFVRGADGEHWRGVKVRFKGGGCFFGCFFGCFLC